VARIPLTDPKDLDTTAREFMSRRGELNVFRLLAGAGRVFPGWTRMVDAQLDSATLSPRLRELVILRVAYLQHSDYELAQHIGLARRTGVTGEEIAAVTAPESPGGFTPAETAVLRLAGDLVVAGTAGADRVAAVERHLGAAALVEVLLLIALYYGLALVLNATAVEVDTANRLEVTR
jgi:4-carboxymuconolactone decarboxylase